MCPFDPRTLIEEDFSRCGFPAHSHVGVRLEEEMTVQCHASRELKRRRIQHEQIDRCREQQIPGVHVPPTEVRGDVDIGIGPRAPLGPTPVEVGELRAVLEQRLLGARERGIDVEVCAHVFSVA